MKLTDADISTLSRAQTLRDRFEAGIFPTGAGQHRHFRKLEKRGLLAFDGWGNDIDGMRDGDVLVYQLTPAAITLLAERETQRLRKLIERPERVQFWGSWYTVTPRLISRIFGDGKLLMCVSPLATRPNRFVVRVDSSTPDPRDPFPATGQVSLLEDIMCAAEEEYGDYNDEDITDEERMFPIVDWGVGCSWGKPFPIYEWKPAPPMERAARRRPVRK